jgi:hypothetical protein
MMEIFKSRHLQARKTAQKTVLRRLRRVSMDTTLYRILGLY